MNLGRVCEVKCVKGRVNDDGAACMYTTLGLRNRRRNISNVTLDANVVIVCV